MRAIKYILTRYVNKFTDIKICYYYLVYKLVYLGYTLETIVRVRLSIFAIYLSTHILYIQKRLTMLLTFKTFYLLLQGNVKNTNLLLPIHFLNIIIIFDL